MKFEIGDIVITPDKNRKSPCSIIYWIDDPEIIKRPQVILIPFTKWGWPSKSSNNFQYYDFSVLDILKPLTKWGGYKKLKVCPECSKKGYSLFGAPLRKFNIYEPKYQCQNCKQVFIIKSYQ